MYPKVHALDALHLRWGDVWVWGHNALQETQCLTLFSSCPHIMWNDEATPLEAVTLHWQTILGLSPQVNWTLGGSQEHDNALHHYDWSPTVIASALCAQTSKSNKFHKGTKGESNLLSWTNGSRSSLLNPRVSTWIKFEHHFRPWPSQF
jgi:hypothetical protein